MSKGFLTLLLLVIFSALAVVYSKFQSRQLFVEIGKLEKTLDQYDVEWGQLQLEQTTHAGHARIESSARKKMDLMLPDRNSIVYIKP